MSYDVCPACQGKGGVGTICKACGKLSSAFDPHEETEETLKRRLHQMAALMDTDPQQRIAALQAELVAAQGRIAELEDIERDWESITGRITEAFDKLGGSRGACQNYYERLDWIIVAQVTQAREERDKLRAFAQDVMSAWPEGAPDGADLQEWGAKYGLLRPETRTEPCGPVNPHSGDHEQCNCEECGVEFPAECYRKTPLLTDNQLKENQ